MSSGEKLFLFFCGGGRCPGGGRALRKIIILLILCAVGGFVFYVRPHSKSFSFPSISYLLQRERSIFTTSQNYRAAAATGRHDHFSSRCSVIRFFSLSLSLPLFYPCYNLKFMLVHLCVGSKNHFLVHQVLWDFWAF